MTNSKETACIICGRLLGTYDGWDQTNDFGVVFYKFKPIVGCTLPPGDLCVDFDKGVAEYYTDDGEVTKSFDLIDALTGLERVQP